MTSTFFVIVVPILLIVLIIAAFSKHTRYHEQGSLSDERTIFDYGVPKKSLFVATTFWSLSQATDITNGDDQVVYTTKSKIISLHDRTWIYDATGNEVAYMYRKFFTLHERRIVQMEDGTEFQLSNELFHVIKDITNIEGLGWKLIGNILGMNFIIQDANEKVLASISQKAISINDKYSIDFYDDSKETYIIAILIGLQHMMRERAAAAASASSSSSSSSN